MNRDRLAEIILEQNIALAERDSAPGPAPPALRHEAALNAERCLAVVDAAAAPPRARVLEVGVGYLYLTAALRLVHGEAVELAGIEHPGRSYLAGDEFRRRIAKQRVDLRLCDVLRDPLPFEDASFDAVLFCDVIEHLPPTEVPALLTALGSLLRPGGRLVVSSSNLPAFYRVATLAAGRGLIFDPPLPLGYAGGTYGHLRLYGRADMEILLDHAGLDLVHWRYLNWERVFIERSSLARRLMYLGQMLVPRVVPRLSTSWVAAAARRQDPGADGRRRYP